MTIPPITPVLNTHHSTQYRKRRVVGCRTYYDDKGEFHQELIFEDDLRDAHLKSVKILTERGKR